MLSLDDHAGKVVTAVALFMAMATILYMARLKKEEKYGRALEQGY